MSTQRQIPKTVILDANIIINLLNINQLHILSALKRYIFWIPNHVIDEVHKRDQRRRLHKAVKQGWLKELEVTDVTEIELYIKNRNRFGKGESACMAVAAVRGWLVGSDESAVKREVTAKLGLDSCLDTRNILQVCVQDGIMDQHEYEKLCEKLNLRESF